MAIITVEGPSGKETCFYHGKPLKFIEKAVLNISKEYDRIQKLTDTSLAAAIISAWPQYLKEGFLVYLASDERALRDYGHYNMVAAFLQEWWADPILHWQLGELRIVAPKLKYRFHPKSLDAAILFFKVRGVTTESRYSLRYLINAANYTPLYNTFVRSK